LVALPVFLKKKRNMKKLVVLVVENEAIIRMNVVQVAEDAGYKVLEAANADEAIEILEGRDDICAVFTDIIMPGFMDGLKLVRAIKGRWPPIRIIVSSGTNVSHHPDFPIHDRFIRKPYENRQVMAALQDVICGQ
jgi:CheY-like chemotaxis protein